MKEMRVVFVAGCDMSKVLNPSAGVFDFPTTFVSLQFMSVWSRRFVTVSAKRTHEFRSVKCLTCLQRIAVGDAFVNQVVNTSTQGAYIEKRFDLSYFGRTGGGEHCRQGLTMAVDEDRGLGTFVTLVLADVIPPFFWDENVPSVMDSFRLISPQRSIFSSNFTQVSASVDTFPRSHQVAGEGKYLTRFFQCTPGQRIQRIPSKYPFDIVLGRPFLGANRLIGKPISDEIPLLVHELNNGFRLGPQARFHRPMGSVFHERPSFTVTQGSKTSATIELAKRYFETPSSS